LYPHLYISHELSSNQLLNKFAWSGRAVYGVGLRPLVRWNCGFESRRGRRYLSVGIIVCCQVEVSGSGWSLVLRSPTGCGVSECERESSLIWRLLGKYWYWTHHALKKHMFWKGLLYMRGIRQPVQVLNTQRRKHEVKCGRIAYRYEACISACTVRRLKMRFALCKQSCEEFFLKEWMVKMYLWTPWTRIEN